MALATSSINFKSSYQCYSWVYIVVQCTKVTNISTEQSNVTLDRWRFVSNSSTVITGLTSHMDDEYKWAGVEDPKIMVTTSRDPSSKLKQFAKVWMIRWISGMWIIND